MASLSGTRDATFEKPYLTKLANAIHKGEHVKFSDNTSEKIIKTQDVRNFIKAVKDKNETLAVSYIKKNRQYPSIFNKRRWIDIDRDQFYKLSAPDAKTTKMQETASLFAIQSAIENNGYKNFRDFIIEHRDNLIKIYPDINEDWEKAIFKQQAKIYKKVGNTKYKHYSRDDGFMNFITELVRTQYGISRKDTWNPADIWLVSEYGKVKNEIVKIIRNNETSLGEFNGILKNMFHERKVIGISLKYVSGKTAQWELVNLENDDVFDDGVYQFSFKSADLNLKQKATRSDFENVDSKIFIDSKSFKVKFQIKRTGSSFSNLTIEGTDLSTPTARLGTAPIDMVARLFRSVNIESQRWRSYRNYPMTIEEYQKQKAIHEKRFKELINTGKVVFGINTVEKFSKNMTNAFENGNEVVANTKLNQLDLLNEIFKLKGDKLNFFLTSLCYLAQKKGKMFGPFAKVF